MNKEVEKFQRLVGGGIATTAAILLAMGVPGYAAILAGLGIVGNGIAIFVQRNINRLEDGNSMSVL